MKAIIFTFSLIITLSLTLTEFAIIKDESNTNQKFTYPSPLDMTKIQTSVNNVSDKNADLQNSDWYSKAIENIEKEEYNISYSKELGAYQSPNRANNIRFIYHNDGFTAKMRDDKIPLFDVNDKTIREEDKEYKTIEEWEITFKVDGITTNSANSAGSTDFAGSEIKASGNKASIEDDKMRIDYTNNKEENLIILCPNCHSLTKTYRGANKGKSTRSF